MSTVFNPAKDAVVEPSHVSPAWSVPAAFCLVLGIAFATLGLPLWLSAICAGGLGLAGWIFGLRWLLLTVLLLPLGTFRYELWEARPQPLLPLIGTTQTLSGQSDGTYLTLDEPGGAKVVLSPRGEVGAGRVTLRGDVVAPSTKRNPGGFDYAAYLARRGVGAQVFVDEVLSFEPAALTFKERLRRGVVAGLGPRQGALMEAMTLGVRDNLNDLQESFAAAGLAHILALSGLNFGILIAVIGFLLKPFGVLRYPVMIAFVIGFIFLVDASPSVLRAGTMAAALLASLWLGAGRLEPCPVAGGSVGAPLEPLASAGLVVWAFIRRGHRDAGPTLRALKASNLPWWHPKALVLGTLVVSVAAQILLLPLLANSFHSIPLLSPVVNIVAIPLATPLVPLGFAAGLLGLVSLPLAGLFNTLTAPIASALIWVANSTADWPSLGWGEIAPVGFIYYGVGALALALVSLGKLRLWRGSLVIAVALTASTVTPPPQQYEIVYLDVGQGDSTLIRLPNRVEILVDAGGTPFSDFDIGENTVVPALRALEVDELELVIASHADTDHIEGLASVLREIPVQELVIGYPSKESEAFEAFMGVAEQKGIPVTEVRRGDVLEVGVARLEILHPTMQPLEETNENSVAFVLSVLGTDALFLGDMGSEIENVLAVPDVDILLAAHHGSRFSTSERLLEAAQPETAVLSYGRNTYGHPNPEVLRRLRTAGADVHRTFLEGAVRVGLGP